MARAVPTPGGGGTPFAKLVDLGDTIVGAYGGSLMRQQRNYKTGDPEWKDEAKTKPRREEVLWLVAMPGTTAKTGNIEKGDLVAVDVEDVIRYAVAGFKWGQIIDGRSSLPAFSGFKAGQICSSDVYTFKLIGWSAATENVAGAQKAGFTVADGRIIMRTQDEKDQYVLARSRQNQPTGVGSDLEITVRRIDQAAEKRFEQLADELFDSKPWERTEAAAGASDEGHASQAPAMAGGGNPNWEEPF